MKPLADRLRPQVIEEVVGQSHLIGQNKILTKIIESQHIPNMIFYGPPGCGKTTVANIIAKATNKRFFKLNATNASTKDIKEIILELDTFMGAKGVLLYLDEIQNFNKKQQQSLLEFIENGSITLIASTTENPYFYVYNAILSRSNVFEFKMVSSDDIEKALMRAVEVLQNDFKSSKILLEDEALKYISAIAGGDVRKALNALELAVFSSKAKDNIIKIDINAAYDATQRKIMNFDKDGDGHYDVLSAFQKSIRGSDADAAVHYLARLIRGGDLLSICRRLMVIACEDIGLAFPSAISIVKSCVDSALQLGFPEARIPLAEATILLATSPKSNSAIVAIDSALADIDNKDIGDIPYHLKDSHYKGADTLGHGVGYLYPHSFENNYVKQQYLPDNIKNAIYYKAGNNKFENNIKMYLNKLINGSDK
ncbi:replication-associated recombination protein A [Clostridium cellulovorans]|uniref:Replication-associated recombination protein A n=1 Tax=Clostridium cellulovorans (strain ATCC 35296 / DSM 3052 / OCM 3 / 743B) TaxID=573061 RepID=D9SL42_CLOC7|nr:replication-associated recombination protein A [Clostridium cellulovorans]ADL51558.1 MgsA AAA+ ATPase-like [Clostridium cellulovorans 743B]